MKKLESFFKNILLMNNLSKKRRLIIEKSLEDLSKKQKALSLGSIRFALKTYYYDNIPLYSWFEVEYLNQLPQDSQQRQIKSIINTLSLKFDLQTTLLLLIVLLLVIVQVNYVFDFWVNLVLGSPELEQCESQAGLQILSNFCRFQRQSISTLINLSSKDHYLAGILNIL